MTRFTATTLILVFLSTTAISQTQKELNKKYKHEDTEYWTPEPKIVTPASTNAAPPSDAIVLFDGKSLNQWVFTDSTSKPAAWTITNKELIVKPGTGNIQTKKEFLDFQIHIEWASPAIIKDKSQDRGNSGLFLASTGGGSEGYEIQILDCYKNKTYVNGQAGSIYKQNPPLANACKKPGVWQTYDIVWTAPRFNEDSSLKSPASITAFHNGVLVQNNYQVKGQTVYTGLPFYEKHGKLPIKLQDHGSLVRYRNIWIREL